MSQRHVLSADGAVHHGSLTSVPPVLRSSCLLPSRLSSPSSPVRKVSAGAWYPACQDTAGTWKRRVVKTCSLRAEVQPSVPRWCLAGSDIDEGTSFVGCSWRVQEVAITEG
ncbi:hypothetical protein E2C01_071490 [Portunus trituberculatus]|uniref:Uncharacterized protein n=1 Tax=Portunus trituberculatus TaxID=210409 RepID=A0A5B7HX53_PORTR|nr:hypothetical protein [Portunus trituberculatus]